MTCLRKIFAAALVCAAATVFAQEGTSLSSDWIELVKGAGEKRMGLELRDIQPGAIEGTRTVTLAVPKNAVSRLDDIEEVLVIGRRPEAPEAPEPMDIQYKWLQDYDEDNYGLVITIGEGNWPIRLFVNSRPGYIN